MNYYLRILVLSIIFTFLDLGWIFLNRDMYLGLIENIQKERFQITNVLYYIIRYIIMLLGLFIICISFVETQIEKNKNINKNLISFLAGGFYGMIVNAIYNFTSLVAYKKYSLYTSIIDICWAFVLYGTISLIYINFS